MRRASFILSCLCLLAPVGCASNLYRAPVRPFAAAGTSGGGLIFTSYQAPLTTNFDRTEARPSKVGEASTIYIYVPLYSLTDFAFLDASIEKACRQGGITRLQYADYEFMSVLGIFSSFKTIVHGD